MKRLRDFWKTMSREPDVTAIAVLILVLGIGAGLTSSAAAPVTLSCSQPLETEPFVLDVRNDAFGPVEFPDLEPLGELEFEGVNPEAGYGPI